MGFHYETNCGQYVLHEDRKPVRAPVDEVSLAFDAAEGILHKHGTKDSVAKWYTEARKRFSEAGCAEMMDGIVVITGRFMLEDLNKCLTTSGYVAVLHQRLLAGELEQLPLTPATSAHSTTLSRRRLR